jgi:hypothetical protein
LDINDADFTCAKFLWATWKAHETMSLYVKHQFYEHPSIAVVLARHLADNHVKPDAAQGTKVANLEKAIKNVNARLDSVQSSVDRMELFVPSEKPDIKIDKKKTPKRDKTKQDKDQGKQDKDE